MKTVTFFPTLALIIFSTSLGAHAQTENPIDTSNSINSVHHSLYRDTNGTGTVQGIFPRTGATESSGERDARNRDVAANMAALKKSDNKLSGLDNAAAASGNKLADAKKKYDAAKQLNKTSPSAHVGLLSVSDFVVQKNTALESVKSLHANDMRKLDAEKANNSRLKKELSELENNQQSYTPGEFLQGPPPRTGR